MITTPKLDYRVFRAYTLPQVHDILKQNITIFIIAIGAILNKVIHSLMSEEIRPKRIVMNTEHIKQNLSDAGCRDELITEIMTLCERGHVREAMQKMKSDRCRLIDELHECGRKIDRLDYLIRQTEKEVHTNH